MAMYSPVTASMTQLFLGEPPEAHLRIRSTRADVVIRCWPPWRRVAMSPYDQRPWTLQCATVRFLELDPVAPQPSHFGNRLADGASNNNPSHGSDLESRMMAVFSMLDWRRAMVQEKPGYDHSVGLDDASFALESQHDVTAGTPKKECRRLDQRAVGDAVNEHESV